jgi:hypothetical protein
MSLLHQLINGFGGSCITQGFPNNEKHSSQNDVLRLIPLRVAMHDTWQSGIKKNAAGSGFK